jgi:lysophospholipase L1-like esterase
MKLYSILKTPCLLAALAAGLCCAAPAPSAPAALKFSFGSGPVPPGFTQVLPATQYDKERGYGFESDTNIALVDRPAGKSSQHSSIASGKPFFFSAKLPAEGNYRVTVTLGDPTAETTTTIRAELRRLMVEKVHTAAGEFKTVSFIVNIRTPKIVGMDDIKAGEVRLKSPRETIQEAWAWDDLLTLEFNNAHPAVSSVEIVKADVPTVYLLGDSTVCDQSREPFASWGQMLTRFFKPEVAVANHAESGETYRDSISRRRLDKILSLLKPGDYVLMQFGHNDQKQIAAGSGGPFTTYKEEIKKHVEGIRKHGGTPVLISPMERRNFDDQGKIKPSLSDYAEASRQSAKELGVAFIDLNAMSIRFYDALGASGRGKVELAFAGTGAKRDATHHDNYGAYELAKCIINGIKENKLPLAKFIAEDYPAFDPAHPDSPDAFDLPSCPQFTSERPLGD